MEVFDSATGKPKPEVLREHFMLEGRLDEVTALKILKEGADILRTENNLIKVQDPINGSSSLETISSILILYS